MATHARPYYTLAPLRIGSPIGRRSNVNSPKKVSTKTPVAKDRSFTEMYSLKPTSQSLPGSRVNSRPQTPVGSFSGRPPPRGGRTPGSAARMVLKDANPTNRPSRPLEPLDPSYYPGRALAPWLTPPIAQASLPSTNGTAGLAPSGTPAVNEGADGPPPAKPVDAGSGTAGEGTPTKPVDAEPMSPPPSPFGPTLFGPSLFASPPPAPPASKMAGNLSRPGTAEARSPKRTASGTRRRLAPALSTSVLATSGAVRLGGSLRRLKFVDRSLLLSFCQSTAYFKEHWSTRALPGGAYRSEQAEALLGAVPCLAGLLEDARRKAGAAGTPCAVTLVPIAAHAPAPHAVLPAGNGEDALVVHCDGDFARARWLRAGRAGGAATVEAALIFHFEAAPPARPLEPQGVVGETAAQLAAADRLLLHKAGPGPADAEEGAATAP